MSDSYPDRPSREAKEPKTQTEPQGAQPDDTSGLDKLTSLKDYLTGPRRELALEPFSDWLRKKANGILKGEKGTPEDLFKFGKDWLIGKLLFGPAADIFALALKKYGDARDPFSNRIRQQLALATYKDEEAPPRSRYKAALAILGDIMPLAEGAGGARDAARADEAETSALRGAVYRRQFDLDGDVGKLHQALECYLRAHECDLGRGKSFEGYGALNAAFLLDSLAFHCESIGKGPIPERAAAEARKKSADLRVEIVGQLKQRLSDNREAEREWLCETMAGASLALGLSKWMKERAGPEGADALLASATSWTERAHATKRAEWTRETTHDQWLRVAYLNEPAAPQLFEYWNKAAEVINVLRTKSGGVELKGPEMARNARLGKVGLALSGGGFRASFYHIGVLARLAEADVLRHVDVLSTVSGGSIVGAHYYLLLRDLLQREFCPTRDQYVELVRTLERQFSTGVQQNLRMRGLSNWRAALKLLFVPSYTRSDRMAELYDEHFYTPTLVHEEQAPSIVEKGSASRNNKGPARMQSLRVTPRGESDRFNPRFSNWRRSARVPALLINATCLNTGHSWHFTANWMGEPPELIGQSVDRNERLRRLSYKDYQEAGGSKDITLGFAVAASACVPGIFEPIRLPDLYPGRLVRLVDGGVHDNQGVDALIGQDCDFILCSDASGQMGDENKPPNGPVSTPSRSMSVLMKRVREGEHADLDARATGPVAGRNLFFVHLKAELPADDVDWLKCKDPTPPAPRKPTTYGVDHEIQRQVSEIRTDLDSFSEVEASALMASGYLMASRELERCVERVTPNRQGDDFRLFDMASNRSQWGFLRLQDKMKAPPGANDIVRADLSRQLSVGRRLFFKNLFLAPRWALASAGIVALALLVVAIGAACGSFVAILSRIAGASLSIGHGVAALTVTAILIGLASALPRFRVWCFESFFALFGFFGSNLYFWLGGNKRFLKRGGLHRLLDLK